MAIAYCQLAIADWFVTKGRIETGNPQSTLEEPTGYSSCGTELVSLHANRQLAIGNPTRHAFSLSRTGSPKTIR
jgi:hypothetical protein